MPRRRLPRQEALYWNLLRQLEQMQGGERFTSDDRHAITIQALGYDKSHKEFSNKEWDLVFGLLRAKLNGQDVMPADAMAKAEEEGERRRLIHGIRKAAPEAYTAAVARDKFAWHQDWRNLSTTRLKQLRMTLQNRARSKAAKQHRAAQEPTLPAVEEPQYTGPAEEGDPF
ncbi:MAG: hypothetical protein AAGF10_07910 [Verrucomicrobiota bacterium]